MDAEKNKAMSAKTGACKTCSGKGTVAKGGKQVRCTDCGGKGTVGYKTK